MGKKDWYKVEIRELIRKNLGKIHRKVGDSYGIDVSYLHKMISDYATQELSKVREEGRGAERDRIFRGLDSIDCMKEALPKNYSASSMQLGINRAKEIVLEKELSKLNNK